MFFKVRKDARGGKRIMGPERQKLILICLSCFTLGLIILLGMVMTIETNLIKAPCVDGDGDKNLEGIMCEKTITTFLGDEMEDQSLLTIFVFLIMGLWGIAFFGFIVFCFTWGDEE